MISRHLGHCTRLRRVIEAVPIVAPQAGQRHSEAAPRGRLGVAIFHYGEGIARIGGSSVAQRYPISSAPSCTTGDATTVAGARDHSGTRVSARHRGHVIKLPSARASSCKRTRQTLQWNLISIARMSGGNTGMQPASAWRRVHIDGTGTIRSQAGHSRVPPACSSSATSWSPQIAQWKRRSFIMGGAEEKISNCGFRMLDSVMLTYH